MFTFGCTNMNHDKGISSVRLIVFLFRDFLSSALKNDLSHSPFCSFLLSSTYISYISFEKEKKNLTYPTLFFTLKEKKKKRQRCIKLYACVWPMSQNAILNIRSVRKNNSNIKFYVPTHVDMSYVLYL